MSDARFITPDPRAFSADELSAYRFVCNKFRFWRACGKECLRKRGCGAANPRACFHHFWKFVDEASKVSFRASIKARRDGHSVAEAMRIGDAAVEQWRAVEARPAVEHTPLRR